MESRINKIENEIELMRKTQESVAESLKEINIVLRETHKIHSDLRLINEKILNMDTNFREYASRVGTRIDSLETSHNGDGCTALKVMREKEATTDTKIFENVKSNQKRLDSNDKHKFYIVSTILTAIILAILNLVLKG